MSVTIDIRIKNIEQIRRAFKKAPALMTKNLDTAIRKTIFFVRAAAVRNAPVRTGFLRGSAYNTFSPLRGETGFKAKYACVFGPDTQVVTETGNKRISSIGVGEKVLAQDGRFHAVLATPRFLAADKPDLVDIETEWRSDRNHKLTLTRDHKVLVKTNGALTWSPAGDLRKGDVLLQRMKVSPYKGTRRVKQCGCCGSSYTSRGKKYCSLECRNNTYRTNHPQLGARRSEEARIRIAAANRKWVKANPDKHPNSILAQRGFKTSIEERVEIWLDQAGIEYIRNKSVGRSFVDFYCEGIKTVFEADGAYWHQNQQKDIERDQRILNELPDDWVIIHLHFVDKRFSRIINSNPLPRSSYVQMNPSMSSFVDPFRFNETKVVNTRHWQHKPPKGSGGKAILYDLTVEDIHSFVASGIIISNSYVHEGSSPYIIRPRAKRALYWKGAAHPVMSVNHPGIRANPFMRRAVNESEVTIDKFFKEAVEDTLHTIAREAG